MNENEARFDFLLPVLMGILKREYVEKEMQNMKFVVVESLIVVKTNNKKSPRTSKKVKEIYVYNTEKELTSIISRYMYARKRGDIASFTYREDAPLFRNPNLYMCDIISGMKSIEFEKMIKGFVHEAMSDENTESITTVTDTPQFPSGSKVPLTSVDLFINESLEAGYTVSYNTLKPDSMRPNDLTKLLSDFIKNNFSNHSTNSTSHIQLEDHYSEYIRATLQHELVRANVLLSDIFDEFIEIRPMEICIRCANEEILSSVSCIARMHKDHPGVIELIHFNYE